jgi:Protein of unknown function (DUF1194)
MDNDRKHPRLSRRTILGSAAALAFATNAHADGPVDLQLVLAVDCSGSVNQTRYEMQRRGYAEAFRTEDVQRAIRSGRRQAIAVCMTQWTGPSLQHVAVPWSRIGDKPGADDFAARIDAMPRLLYSGGTSISGAIDHGVGLFATSQFPSVRKVIDVSGDGANNRGRSANDARDDAIKAGVTINGLPIMALEPNLDTYYRENVIGGDTAFMVVAESYETFGAAVRRKLIQEIAARPHREGRRS